MKELEKELSQKASSLSELKQQLKETNEREDRARINIQQLEDQVMYEPGTRRHISLMKTYEQSGCWLSSTATCLYIF